MTTVNNILSEASKAVDGSVEFRGLMSKKARIKHGQGKTPEDILGWDVVVRDKYGTCYKFYMAQPPLIGMTRPEPIECPLGLVAFNSYNVDFKEAISKIDQLDCGDAFVAMSLSWPLTPACKEPLWHIRMSIGNDIVIGADSGKIDCSSPIVVLYGVKTA